MLQIRPEQMAFLQQTFLDDFIARMVAHLQRVFPDRCRELGEKRTSLLVRLNHQQAAVYGICSERDVCAFVDVLFSLHKEDASGEDMQWARAILEDPRLEAAQKNLHLSTEAKQRIPKAPVVS